MILGIDPGLTGALAMLDDDGKVRAVYDTPVAAKTHGKGNEVDASGMFRLLEDLATTVDQVFIERVWAMRRPDKSGKPQGGTSLFGFGDTNGCTRMGLVAASLPFEWVLPAQWKTWAGLKGKPKDASRTLAIQRHPEVADQLSRKKDDGRAEAILIADYGRHQLQGLFS